MNRYQNPVSDKEYLVWKENPALIPFVFTYAGKEYSGLSFPRVSVQTERVDEKETSTQVFAVDKNLQLTLILTHYYDYGATEYTVWFENIGNENTEIIEDPRLYARFKGEKPVVRGILGDHENRYRPYVTRNPLGSQYFSSEKGRATHVYFPYFNIENDNGGVMFAIGWAGRWEVYFENKTDSTLCVARYAGNIKTYLKPNEKIRTPLYLMASYTVRDEHYATNYWRSWFIKYNTPKADKAGNPLQPFSTLSMAGDTGLPNCDGSISENKDTWKRTFDKLFAENIRFDYRWMDAGYYPDPSGATRNDYWGYVGAWEMDENKWGKKGEAFVKSVDYAHAHGVKTLLWVEAERVCMVDELVKNYGYNADWAVPQYDMEYSFSDLYILNNIGNPDCYAWVKDNVCKLLKDNKIDLYREDFNRDPAYAWDKLDRAENPIRFGINECKSVAAHYQLWQDVIACTSSYGGGAFIDSCASGGGRNDLQSLRYAVPVLRSDFDRTSTSLRLSMSTSFNRWIPFNGACHMEKAENKETEQNGVCDEYTWRASYLPIMNVLGGEFTQDKDYDFEMLRWGLNEWNSVKKYLIKDFYPLTPWHAFTDKTGFTAHCYFDEETGDGILLAFRMEECKESDLAIDFSAIKRNAEYEIIDQDSKAVFTTTDGKIRLTFPTPRLSKLLWIKRK